MQINKKHVAHTQSQRQTSHDQKSLDTVQHGFMIKARWKIRRNMETCQHNKGIYQHLVNVILNRKSDSIAYKTGMRQGYSVTPLSFKYRLIQGEKEQWN